MCLILVFSFKEGVCTIFVKYVILLLNCARSWNVQNKHFQTVICFTFSSKYPKVLTEMDNSSYHQYLLDYSWDSFIVQRGKPPAWFTYDPYKPPVWDNRGMSNYPFTQNWGEEDLPEPGRLSPSTYKPPAPGRNGGEICRRDCFSSY